MQFAARLTFLIAASTTPRVSTFSFSLLSLEIYKKVLSPFFSSCNVGCGLCLCPLLAVRQMFQGRSWLSWIHKCCPLPENSHALTSRFRFYAQITGEKVRNPNHSTLINLKYFRVEFSWAQTTPPLQMSSSRRRQSPATIHDSRCSSLWFWWAESRGAFQGTNLSVVHWVTVWVTGLCCC